MSDLAVAGRVNEADTPDVRITDPSQRTLLGWIGMPLFLVLLFGVTYVAIQSRELDRIESRTLNPEQLWFYTRTHLELVAVSTIIVVVLAIPLGVILTRRFARRAVPVVLAVANAGQSIPSLGLITIIVLWRGIGFWSVIIGLVAYSALPILRNTMVGLQQVDKSLIKAARGMGMSRSAVLMRIELPLAVPVMIAGIRTALILNVGTATLATFFGANGLGFIIYNGITLSRFPVLITGVVMAAGLALLISYLADCVGYLLSPKGL